MRRSLFAIGLLLATTPVFAKMQATPVEWSVGQDRFSGYVVYDDAAKAKRPGLVMAAIFASIWFGPWKALQQAVAAESWAQGAQALNQIRQRVSTNLLLGAFVVALASLGLAI